jgi:hypothetical protein
VSCVCGHGKYLHRQGVCMAVVNPCGCTFFETEAQAQKPTSLVGIDHYDGIYADRRFEA